jgi:hypothetical protein
MEENISILILGILMIAWPLIALCCSNRRKLFVKEIKKDFKNGAIEFEHAVESEIKADIDIVKQDFVEPIKHIPGTVVNVTKKLINHEQTTIASNS